MFKAHKIQESDKILPVLVKLNYGQVNMRQHESQILTLMKFQ